MVRSNNSSNTDLTKYADATKIVEQLPLDKDFQSNFNNVRQGGGKKTRKQKGSGQGNIGYILNVEKARIGGLAEVNGYQTQPEYVNGKVSTTEDLCGGGRVNLMRSDRGPKVGGMRRKTKKNKRFNNKRNKNIRKKTKRSGSSSRKSRIGNRRVNRKMRSLKNNKKRRINKLKKMKKGGSWLEKCHSVQGEGQQGVFHDKMMDRSFDCKQPNWDPKCT